MMRTPTLLLLLLLVLSPALFAPTTSAHRVSTRTRGSQEEQQKAAARNQAEKENALRQINEEEEKNVKVSNQPAEEQEKSNLKFMEHCRNEEREAEVAQLTASEEKKKQDEQTAKDIEEDEAIIDPPPPPTVEELKEMEEKATKAKEAEVQAEEALTKAKVSMAAHAELQNNAGDAEAEKLGASLMKMKEAVALADAANAKAKLAVVDRGIKMMCLTKFNPSKEHVDCSGLMSKPPIINVYDLTAWDAWSGGEEGGEKTKMERPPFLERFDILKYPTAIPKCWSYLEACIPGIQHFAPSAAAVSEDEEEKEDDNKDGLRNEGLGPLLERFGVMSLMENKLKGMTLESMLPASASKMAPSLEILMGPQKLFDLNVRPLLENTNDMWGERLFDQGNKRNFFF